MFFPRTCHHISKKELHEFTEHFIIEKSVEPIFEFWYSYLINLLFSCQTPNYETDYTETASPHHPIGAKGVGESPNVGGVSAFSNAVHDAFKPFGLTQAHMPHDHWRVWKIAKDLGLHN